jgi:hypothetical protein
MRSNRPLTSSDRRDRRGSSRRQDSLRQQLAVEAARIISEQGIRDYGMAKRKAADRLGVDSEFALPSNREVDAALTQHQQLFQSLDQPRWLHQRRVAAVEAMRFLGRFEPRLVGAVLEGNADQHSAVCLHVFCQHPVDVENLLRDHRIPFESDERRVRLDAERDATVPVLHLVADDLPFDISLFDLDGLRQAPLDRITERPMRRAGIDAVSALIDKETRTLLGPPLNL